MAELTQKERTRERILDEAAKALRLHGVDGVGVATLMKGAGLTHGGFYAHFANRDDLVAHAIDRMFEQSMAMLGRHLGHDDAAAGLRSLIDQYLSDDMRLSPGGGCPMAALSGQAASMAPEARRRFDAGVVAFRSSLARAIEAIGAPEPQLLASSVLAEMVGAMALARTAVSLESAEATLRASRHQLRSRLGV